MSKKVICLYAGIGTTIEAFINQGYEIIAIYEPRPFFKGIINQLHPNVNVYTDLIKLLEIESGNVDILYCEMGDVIHLLHEILFKLLEKFNPVLLLLSQEENSYLNKNTLLINDLSSSIQLVNYTVKQESYDISYFNVPQNRKWKIIYGVNNKFNILPTVAGSNSQKKTQDVIESFMMYQDDSTKLDERWMQLLEKYLYPEISVESIKKIYEELNMSISPKLLRRDTWSNLYLNLTIKDLPYIHPLKNRRLSKQEICAIQGINPHLYNQLPIGFIVESTPTTLIKGLLESLDNDFFIKL